MQDEAVDEPGARRGAQPAADLVRPVSEALAATDLPHVRALVEGLEPADLADLIEHLDAEQRTSLIEALGSAFRPEVLSELDATVRDQLLPALPKDLVAKAVAELETDDAAYLLESLEPAARQDILAQHSDRRARRRSSATSNTRRRRPAVSCRRTSWRCRRSGRSGGSSTTCARPRICPRPSPTSTWSTPSYHVLGSVDLSRLLRTKREVGIETIMDASRHVVVATADQEEMARQFERYDLKSAPVVDANKRLVGVVTVDDVVEVIEEEAEEDMRRLGGVGDESVADNVIDIVRNRFSWLFINLGTALLSASVDQAVRCDHRSDGGAGGADADRGLHRRQCRPRRP